MKKFKAFILAIACLIACACGRIFTDPDHFQVYLASLDGSDLRAVMSHPYLGLSHARVSPDKKWFTFTRYTSRRLLSGYADESDGYFGTEIGLAKIDGSDMRILVPAKDGLLACNSTWTPDGRNIVYVSTDTGDKLPKLKSLNLQSGETEILPTPKGLSVADPDIVGNQLVFPAIEEKSNTIWLMDMNGGKAIRLTSPVPPEGFSETMRYGDYDPKLSPDAKKVAFMRYFGENEWHVIIYDIEKKSETDLSTKGAFDAIPEWSGDGELLIFIHIDFDNLEKLGVYTMNSDGSSRKMVPLPRKMVHGHPRFLPGEGSGPGAKFVFTSQKNIFIP